MSDLVLSNERSWSALSLDERRVNALKLLNARSGADLGRLLDDYLHYKRDGVSANTSKAYRRALRLLLESDLDLIRLSEDEAVRFVRGMNAHYKPATRELYRSALRTFYNALIWCDAYRGSGKRVLVNPFEDIRIAGKGAQRVVFYTDVDMRVLLAAADPEQELILLLGGHAGLRAQEMVDLKWRDVDLGNRYLNVLGKGQKRRDVPLTASVLRSLQSFRHFTEPLPYRNYDAVYYAFDTLCKEAYDERTGHTVNGAGLHPLRRYAANKMYRATRDIQRVAKYLGHTNSQTTERYIDVGVRGFDDGWAAEFAAAFGQQSGTA